MWQATSHLMTPRLIGMDVGSNLPRSPRPPDSIEQPPLPVDAAAAMMADLGFLAFRTSADVPGTDSCLMVMIRDDPTLRHFDPQTVWFWTLEDGRGHKEIVDRETRSPLSQPFSWGRIRLEDRFGVRNDFVTFGGWLTAERVGPDALLLLFRSAAPILRLGGHSQPGDRLADESLAFFGRLLPRTWTGPAEERFIGSVPPEHLWAAFLLYEAGRLEESSGLREAWSSNAPAVHRELATARLRQTDALAAGRRLLPRIGLWHSAARVSASASRRP